MVRELSAGPPNQKPALRFPDFLCIGVQKSATSWLDTRLRRHPRLWLPPMKELQYFSELHIDTVRRWAPQQRRLRMTGLLQRYTKTVPRKGWDCDYIELLADIAQSTLDDAWYGRIFAHAPAESMCGEVTPDYAHMRKRGIAHVVAVAPKVRIILSLRDPIERSWSHIRMFARNRGLTELSELEAVARHSDFVRRANYPAIIARWRGYVPDERFHVLFLDDVEREPARVLTEVCRFLETDCPDEILEGAGDVVHGGEAREMPPSVLDILKLRLREIYREFEVLYPEAGARWSARYF